jgi:Icc protein
MDSFWLDSVGMENGEEFLDYVVSLRRVRLVVFGHVHQPFDSEYRGVRIIGTPSTCGQFLPGSDEFAVDSRPPAYRRITLFGNGNYATELVWVDED